MPSVVLRGPWERPELTRGAAQQTRPRLPAEAARTMIAGTRGVGSSPLQ
jgi:hypothetical protein